MKLDWDRIQEIYHEARQLPPAERRAFVEKACENDTDSASVIMDLLYQDDEPFPEPPINLPLTTSVDDLVGRTIGERYLVEKELDGGGMSRVYLARDRNVNGRAVVLKVLSRELLEHEYARQKFKQEVEALIRIDHRGVVDVSDTGTLGDGRPYFVMQFINGENLRSLIRPEGMSLHRAASILRQIGDALNRAHENGVFHRDLKLENIMLRRGTDSVVLIDFGIAKVVDSSVAPITTHEQSAGTLMYMSPEQLLAKEVTAATDIYSMAVIAYELVTGRLPFDAKSQAQLVEQQRKRSHLKPRVLRQDLPAEAEDIILRGLLFEPQARYQNAKQFGDSLADALVGTHVPLPLPPRKVLAALLSLIGIAVIGLVIIYWPRPTRSFTYYLTVQPMRDGKPSEQSFKAHGEELFTTGDQFQLTVITPVSAYLYIFKEEGPAPNDTSFRLIYPRLTINNGSASLGPDQSVQSDWYTFTGPAGAENFWLVWSTSPVPELESVITDIFNQGGGLTGQTLVNVKQYLTTKETEINAITYNYNANKNAVVRKKQDLLVALAQFKHH